MRLVFISSVTAMTPLRTISVTTGSVLRLLMRPLRAELLGLNFLLIALGSVVPAKAGTPNHRHLGLSLPMRHRYAAAYGSPPSRRLRGDDNNKCWRTKQGGVHAPELKCSHFGVSGHGGDWLFVRIEHCEPWRHLGHEALHRAR